MLDVSDAIVQECPRDLYAVTMYTCTIAMQVVTTFIPWSRIMTMDYQEEPAGDCCNQLLSLPTYGCRFRPVSASLALCCCEELQYYNSETMRHSILQLAQVTDNDIIGVKWIRVKSQQCNT